MQQLRHRSHAAATTTILRVEGDEHRPPAANRDATHDTTTTTTDYGKEHYYLGWLWNKASQQYRLYCDSTNTRRMMSSVRSKHNTSTHGPTTTARGQRGTMVVMIVLSILMLLVVVWNERSIGIYVDDYLRQRYHGQIQQQQQNAFRHQSRRHSFYPDVTIKATRKVEHAHYSYYLYEILQHYHHQHDNATTSTATTTNRNLSRDPPITAYTGRRKNVPSSITTTLILSSVIEIDGLPDFQKHPRNHPVVIAASPVRRRQWWDWFCDRCVRTGYRGSYPHCRAVCSWTYLQQMYFPNALLSSVSPKKSTSATPLAISPISVSYRAIASLPATIPRIIHQAWDDTIRTLEFPELARIQNTYRSMTGYEYYYYNEALQLQFLQEHYPAFVVQMYESMTNIDQRYSIFSLLILYKMGGVYANVDVVLEVHLDALLFEKDEGMDDDDEISLIVVRNPNIIQPHCTFNILIAAVPGHPIIGSMIETTLQSFVTLSTFQATTSKLLPTQIWPTYFNDITTLDEISKVPIWKLHTASATSPASVNDYIYCGNCAWGRTIHRITSTGRNPNDVPLANLNVWELMHLRPADDHGNQTTTRYGSVKILMASEDDTGATRITDMNRNLLVASTHVVGVHTDRRMPHHHPPHHERVVTPTSHGD